MSLSIGIVGLPNVGKSTLFNALVKGKKAEASNYPFCTIDPNVGVVEVPDKRLQKLAKFVHPEKIIPATVEFIDIAGLVKNAHQGEGLGNQFLAHIREVNAIAMVLRCFTDAKVAHVAGKIDPKDDLETIQTELELADLGTLEKRKTKNAKLKTEDNINLLAEKPIIYVANINESNAACLSHEIIAKYNLESVVKNPETLIPISAKIESELVDMKPEEQKEYLAELGLSESGLNRLIRTAYKILGLQTFFTAGPKEVRAWTIKKGSTAPVAAGKIHTDFERGFICAEVISYEDYINNDGELGARSAGKLRQEGREYIVKDGDIIEFKFNV